jgi:hypothetical protein
MEPQMKPTAEPERFLHLHLRAEYFDAIKAGTKKEEFRLHTGFYTKRLSKAPFAGVVLYRRYPKAEAERDSLRKALEVAQPYVVWCDPEGRDAGDYPAAKAIVERDAKLVTAALSGLPAQAGGRKCEGCAEPATHRDNEGIPLCKACYDSLLDEP